jgi:hypothetical protein
MHASSTFSGAPGRNTAAILIFVACCLLSTVRLIRDAPNPFHLKADDISQRSDQRFAALQETLPNQGVFGYIGESVNSALPDYYLAQYALAPRVIDRSPDHPLVIGNFPSSAPTPPSSCLRLIQDFGNGVLLFANQDAK